MPQYVLFHKIVLFRDILGNTIHKFQGFGAGFDKKDMFQHLLVDPGNLKWEQTCLGEFYVALSRAKTMGTFPSGMAFQQDSAIYWNGPGISTARIREGHMKRGKEKVTKKRSVV